MMVAMREETQDLVVKKCIALVFLSIFFYLGGYTYGIQLQSSTIPQFSRAFHHVGNRTGKK